MNIAVKPDVCGPARRLAAAAGALRSGLTRAVGRSADAVLARTQNKLSGEVLALRTGALRDSMTESFQANDGAAPSAHIQTDGSVPYARIQEFGGRVGIPAIAARDGKVLAFEYAGKLVFARRTVAHEIEVPARSYLRSSLAEQAHAIVGTIREAIADSLA